MFCQAAFWISVTLLGYTFLGYQLIISFLSRLRRSRADGPTTLPAPATALVIASNEEDRIAERVRNLLTSACPLNVAVCSDGSTDATGARARQAGAQVFEFPTRRGKAACLSEVIPLLDTPLVVLTDSRQEFTPDTVPRLLRHFADPRIGAVSGILRIGRGSTSTGAGVNVYWKMETAIRQAESDLDSCVGCTGAVYAIRRSLFSPIPADTILDDVVIPMLIALSGHRVIYDSWAEAFDPQALDPRAETRRKARTLAGNFQMLLRYPTWLLPWKNRLWWQLISHKYLRLAGPALLVCALAACWRLRSLPFYRCCFFLQGLLYLFALAGILIPRLRPRLFSIPAGFLFLNLMTIRGCFRYLFGSKSGAWEKTAQPRV